MEKNLSRAMAAIQIANTAFVFSVLFVVAGFALPESLGQLINPHSQMGSKGMTLVMLVWLAVLIILLVSLSMVFTMKVRGSTYHPMMKSARVVFGSIVALFLGALTVSLVASEL
jgi:uncharacterized membrane protein